jgi:hypothetical protein
MTYSSTLKMKTVYSSVEFHGTRQKTELHSYRCEKLRSYMHRIMGSKGRNMNDNLKFIIMEKKSIQIVVTF